jgi:phage terminase large subunit-like protein
MLMMGLRLGNNPQVVVATTPKPITLLKEIRASKGTRLTLGSTYENKANLASSFINSILNKYEGTSLGRQELYGDELEDSPGALWRRKHIDLFRVKEAPKLIRVVVAIDPAATSGDESNETGIIVAGLGEDQDAYILSDLSCRLSPQGWANKAVDGYDLHNADLIVGETNNGGDMIECTVRTVRNDVSYKGIHASKGKHTRAEPVSSLYERGRVHHVGVFTELEDQMCTWVPGLDSPDRLDATVWAITELLLNKPPTTPILSPSSFEMDSRWR